MSQVQTKKLCCRLKSAIGYVGDSVCLQLQKSQLSKQCEIDAAQLCNAIVRQIKFRQSICCIEPVADALQPIVSQIKLFNNLQRPKRAIFYGRNPIRRSFINLAKWAKSVRRSSVIFRALSGDCLSLRWTPAGLRLVNGASAPSSIDEIAIGVK